MPIIGTVVKGKYFDSVKLMLISKEFRQRKGVVDAVAIMGTVENKSILRNTGMLLPEFEQVNDNEICIAINAENDEIAGKVMDEIREWIEKGGPTNASTEQGTILPRSIDKAHAMMPEANMALISVAGKYAGREAKIALDNGLNVMLFSDNVSMETEKELKEYALSKDLLCMGPDCGTAIINGVPLAFSNVVRKGRIGIVSASGTGLQEVSSVINNLGEGISQAFGTGGRDGKKEIGGLMILACLEYLIEDKDTNVIVLISKVPDQAVVEKIWKLIESTKKPVVVNFLRTFVMPKFPNLHAGLTLADTAYAACYLLAQVNKNKIWEHGFSRPLHASLDRLPGIQFPAAPRKYLRGIFSGGTLCYEAQFIYNRKLGDQHAYSNAPLDSKYKLEDAWISKQDTIIDLGADEFTVGRPHPMIDYSLRMKKIEEESKDVETALILLDVVLGYGSHMTPHLELAPVIRQITSKTDIVVICAVVGTDQDPQNRHDVMDALGNAGAVVTDTNADACELAAELLSAMRRG
ncbi:MAG TPA: acyl-CoA synthetase FdrA [Candidatus Cloacimonadota bacterium]|nr:acyl-CoA synthetase FdrA [Candidatus Cloacimonadota bacterium]